MPHGAPLTWSLFQDMAVGQEHSGYDELPWLGHGARAGAKAPRRGDGARRLVVALLAVILAMVVGCGGRQDEGQRSYPHVGPLRTAPDRVKATQAIIDRFEQQTNMRSSWPRSVRIGSISSSAAPVPLEPSPMCSPPCRSASCTPWRPTASPTPTRPPPSSTPSVPRPSPAGLSLVEVNGKPLAVPERQLDPAAGLPQGPVRRGRPGRAHHLRRDPDGGHQARRDGMAGTPGRYQAGRLLPSRPSSTWRSPTTANWSTRPAPSR